MTRWILGTAVSVLVIALVALGQPPLDESGTVATVGSTEIRSEVFRTGYVDYLLKTGLHDSSLQRSAFLNSLVARRLVVVAADDEGLIDEKAYGEQQAIVVSKLLLEAYARQVVYGAVEVSQADVEELFLRASTQLTVRHLFARTSFDAESLLRRLDAGDDFEALARETFRDTTLAKTGGLIGPFSFDEMDPAFEDAAFALDVGETSGPVPTDYGYSIIRLEERFQKPILTETEFAQRKDKLEGFVRYRKQRAARSLHVRQLEDDLQIQFVDPTVDRLLDWITGRQLAPDEEQLGRWLQEPLVVFGTEDARTTWTVSDFRDLARRTGEAHRAKVQTRDDLVTFASGLVVRETMIERARSTDLQSHRAFEYALELEMEEWAYEQAYDRLVSMLPDTVADRENVLGEHVTRLRDNYGVQINEDVLYTLPLIKPESS